MISWIPKLSPSEWPEGVIPYMSPTLFNYGLIPLRERSGVPMTPSPLVEGHIRKNSKGRHSIDNRKSDATDIFIPSTITAVSTILREAQKLPIGGFGLYFDTKPSVMFHIDMRPERLMWLRVKGEYIYEINDPVRFYETLAEELTKLKMD